MSKNPLVKKANQQQSYSINQVEELERCMNDPIYFIKTYCTIQHPVKGSIPFALFDYQERMISAFAEFRQVITLAPRQIGKSWCAGAFLLWYAIFRFEQTILIASNKNDNAMEMIHRIRYMYEKLPAWIKPGVTADGWNKHNVGFDNGSRIHSTATSENSGRGLSISLLFLDEFAFVRDTIQQEFWTSMAPTLSTGGACIICSTPNGDSNLFAQLWRGAAIPHPTNSGVGVNEFAPVTVKWNEPPDRGEEFKVAETAKIGHTRWLQEYECVFISSDPLLIDTVVLSNLTAQTLNNKPTLKVGDIVFYRQPPSHTTYLVGMDPATGSGKDYTTIVVFEFPSMQQVAEYRSNTTSSALAYYELKKMLKILEKTNSTVYFSVENNGVGEAIMALFEADESPPETAEFVSESGKNRRGMTTTSKSKMKACLAFKEMIEKNTINIMSPVIISEAKNFVRVGGSYEAKTGATDDLISSCLVSIRIIEEIATFDQTAHDKLYSSKYTSDESSDYSYDELYTPDPIVI